MQPIMIAVSGAIFLLAFVLHIIVKNRKDENPAYPNFPSKLYPKAYMGIDRDGIEWTFFRPGLWKVFSPVSGRSMFMIMIFPGEVRTYSDDPMMFDSEVFMTKREAESHALEYINPRVLDVMRSICNG